MVRYWIVGLTSLFCVSSVFGVSFEEILQKIDQSRAPAESFATRMMVTFKTDHKLEKLGLWVRVKHAKKSLVVYTSPPVYKGRVLLMVEDNLWVYIPGTRTAIRISPQQQLMGQVSNADVARVVFHLDYQVSSMTPETLNNEPVLKVVLDAKTKAAAYKTVVMWVKKEGCTPIKATFFALSGRPLKTAYYKHYTSVFGKMLPMLLEIHDHINSEAVTTIEYTGYELDTTPESYFQKSYIERVSNGN